MAHTNFANLSTFRHCYIALHCHFFIHKKYQCKRREPEVTEINLNMRYEKIIMFKKQN